MAGEGVEVWRGGVAPWECDEMGHLNVRFYLARAMEGLASLAGELGLAGAFAPSASSTLIVREHHVRFLNEARVGAPLFMTAGVAAMDEDSALLVQILRHSRTGEPSAGILTRVVHATMGEARPFAWSQRTRERAQGLTVAVPDIAAPRGLPGEPVAVAASRARAEAMNIPVIGRGVVQPSECDPFGRMRPDAVMGRLADGVAHLFEGVHEVDGARYGRVLLEARLIYAGAAVIGAPLELRSAPSRMESKTQRFTHWLLDPIGGQAYASAMVLGASFDLDKRRIASVSEKTRAWMDALRIDDMGF